MVLPCAVGNLQKGERFVFIGFCTPLTLLTTAPRYANMDFVFASSIQHLAVLCILVSYDIACQWFKNFFQRMEDHWPDNLKIPSSVELIPAIPKLHEPMHEADGHEVFSLNFIPGVGASDLECPERFWAGHNALGNSMKNQGPGSRHDNLDDHFNFWNWQKYMGMGKTLKRRYKAAVAERNIQREGHRRLTASLDDRLVATWEAMCVAWEKDVFPKMKASPYETNKTSKCFLFCFSQISNSFSFKI
jgi:hypothetical protein